MFAGDDDDTVDITGGGRSTPERQTVMVDGGDGDDVVNAAGYDVAANAASASLSPAATATSADRHQR